MASQTENAPLTGAPETPHTGFDVHEFVEEHKQRFMLFGVLLAVGLIAFAGYQYWRHERLQAAAAAFARATDAPQLRAVIAKYPNTVVAANAQLLLAEKLRADKKFEESDSLLRRFIEKYPKHPLVAGAWMGLAANAEAQGKADAALQAYQQVVSKYPTSYAVPLAMLSQGRLLEKTEKIDNARRIYEALLSQHPQSVFAQEAMRQLGALPK